MTLKNLSKGIIYCLHVFSFGKYCPPVKIMHFINYWWLVPTIHSFLGGNHFSWWLDSFLGPNTWSRSPYPPLIKDDGIFHNEPWFWNICQKSKGIFLNESEFDKYGIRKITLKVAVFHYRLHSSKSSCISLSPVKAIISEIVLHPNQIWCGTYHL